MPLVTYNSSSSGEEEPVAAERNTLKRKRYHQKERNAALPALPSSFHDLYASAARMSTHDDPSLHGGRKRAIPHIEGQWPSHVFLEWIPLPAETSRLNELLVQVCLCQPKSKIVSLVTSPLGVPLPLHISLSAPLSLATDQRAPFIASLGNAVSRVQPFTVSLSSLKWFPNEQRTRWFLVLGVDKPDGDELNALLKACNTTVKLYGLRGLYIKARGEQEEDYTSFFHFSIAWSLTSPSSFDGLLIEDKDVPGLKNVTETRVKLDTVKVKIGDTVTSLGLAPQHRESKNVLV